MALTTSRNVAKNRNRVNANLWERVDEKHKAGLALSAAQTDSFNNAQANALEMEKMQQQGTIDHQALSNQGAMNRTALTEKGKNIRDLRDRRQHIGDQNFQVNREDYKRKNFVEDRNIKNSRADKAKLAATAQGLYQSGADTAAIDTAMSRARGGNIDYGGFKQQPGKAQYQPVSVMNDETGQTDTFAFNRSTGGMRRSGGADPAPVTSGVAQPTPLIDDAITSYRTQGAALSQPASPQAPAQALPQPQPPAPVSAIPQPQAAPTPNIPVAKPDPTQAVSPFSTGAGALDRTSPLSRAINRYSNSIPDKDKKARIAARKERLRNSFIQ